ncbi:MAG: hypothetical protein K6F70_02040 [Eggerthellaceae bacterium]|nr:hypothetical protein [Eggerthellaceae bacterium]
MAQKIVEPESVFGHSALNRVSSSDELDQYIKVANPSAWVIALASLLLMVGIAVWAAVAIVPVTFNLTGFAYIPEGSTEPVVFCLVDKSTLDKIQDSGATVSINGTNAEIESCSATPISASEVKTYIGSDYYDESLHLSDWNYVITIKPSGELPGSTFSIATAGGEARLVPVSMVVSETRPINIVLGKQ